MVTNCSVQEIVNYLFPSRYVHKSILKTFVVELQLLDCNEISFLHRDVLVDASEFPLKVAFNVFASCSSMEPYISLLFILKCI